MMQINEEISEWIKKANNDLNSAAILIEHNPPVFDTACFHCQQAVEKALKAFLVSRKITFEKIHNTSYLTELCIKQDPDFIQIREQAELLAPYAVEIRYPGSIMDFEENEASQAFDAAKTIFEMVNKKLQ
jgi:HEPN domain-containing protein